MLLAAQGERGCFRGREVLGSRSNNSRTAVKLIYMCIREEKKICRCHDYRCDFDVVLSLGIRLTGRHFIACGVVVYVRSIELTSSRFYY